MSSKKTSEYEQDKEVIQVKNDFEAQALEIITKILPKKVVVLTNLLKDETLLKEQQQVRQPIKIDSEEDNSQRKKRKLGEDASMDVESNGKCYSTAKIPMNSAVSKLYDIMKSNIIEFIEHVSKVKIWIQLNVPRIEDGNNFGVSIQEDTLGELTTSEDTAHQKLNSISKYYLNRAKLVSKCIKYPGVEDYRQAIIELDDQEYNSAWLSIREMRDCYAILYDMILKNFDRIRKPRSEIAVSLY